jgi:cold shock CspA family protein
MTRARAEPIFVTDAHRGDGKRFIARADEKADCFLELEQVTRESLSL